MRRSMRVTLSNSLPQFAVDRKRCSVKLEICLLLWCELRIERFCLIGRMFEKTSSIIINMWFRTGISRMSFKRYFCGFDYHELRFLRYVLLIIPFLDASYCFVYPCVNIILTAMGLILQGFPLVHGYGSGFEKFSILCLFSWDEK